MNAIGIDIGTTTVCAVLLDVQSGRLLSSRTLPNTSALEGKQPYEKMQDPSAILSVCIELLNLLLLENSGSCTDDTDIIGIGITGQMHGILYLDQHGCPVSPLYTWQDGCGNLPYVKPEKGKLDLSANLQDCGMNQGAAAPTYAQYLKEMTGYSMATGFGLTTHFYLAHNHLIPADAASLCTIPDYVAMKLAGLKRPVLHPSMAASLGLYDLDKQDFDKCALQKLPLDISCLPQVTAEDTPLGYYRDKIPVAPALGDNQASFLGSVNGTSNVLVNVGTGSQISVCCDSMAVSEHVEYRPYLCGKYLMAGSSLCGGYAYALLKKFFEQCAQMLGQTAPQDIYERMNACGSDLLNNESPLAFDTRFQGTRKDPEITASITNLTVSGFTPGHMIRANLQGICNELYFYYQELPDKLRTADTLVGSGNGIRQNPLLQQIFQDTFHMPLTIPRYSEEASYGAALYSLLCGNHVSNLEELQKLIQYTDNIIPLK